MNSKNKSGAARAKTCTSGTNEAWAAGMTQCGMKGHRMTRSVTLQSLEGAAQEGDAYSM